MDLQMPIMDGYEATKVIAELSPGIPIVACSASALAEVREQGEIEFDDYLGKALKKAELYKVLNKYLNNNITKVNFE